MDVKLALYESAGVKEYWIVNPANRTVIAYRAERPGTFGKPVLYSGDEAATSPAFPGLSASLPEIFAP